MKFIVALQNKMDSVKAQALNCLKRKEGQNTIEYVLMLVVVVGVYSRISEINDVKANVCVFPGGCRIIPESFVNLLRHLRNQEGVA